MKVVIFAGGKGTRLSEETVARPKPMVEIGGRPILWHIMKHFARYGHKEFVVLLGYKGYLFKEYFSNYVLHQSDITVDLGNNEVVVHRSGAEDWKVSLVDTGEDTLTAGRLSRARAFIGDETFLMTYGDGVSDVDLDDLTAFHRNHGGILTVSAVQPDSRYGVLEIDGDERVRAFQEKPPDQGHWINGGFFVCGPEVFDHLPASPECDGVMWERQPMESITRMGGLFARRHYGFWQCMDTMRDKSRLEELWAGGSAPWKIWE